MHPDCIGSRDRSPDRQLDAPRGWNRKPLSLGTIPETYGGRLVSFSSLSFFWLSSGTRVSSRANVAFRARPARSEK